MKLEIKCTKEHLKEALYCGTDKALKSVSKSCWIAVAVRDVFPDAGVGYKDIKHKNFLIPHDQEDIIDRFDLLSHKPLERLKLQPFSFTIDVPDALIEQINIDDYKNHPTLKFIEV